MITSRLQAQQTIPAGAPASASAPEPRRWASCTTSTYRFSFGSSSGLASSFQVLASAKPKRSWSPVHMRFTVFFRRKHLCGRPYLGTYPLPCLTTKWSGSNTAGLERSPIEVYGGPTLRCTGLEAAGRCIASALIFRVRLQAGKLGSVRPRTILIAFNG